MNRQSRPAMGSILYFLTMLMLAIYFAFAAVQGNYGVFKRAEINAEGAALAAELARLDDEVTELENLTIRLSDNYLDLDLLDQQARDVLGLIRADEIVIQ